MAAPSESYDAVVLRSMRYGEADRILHAVTPDLGRVSAIARGARKPTSKLGGRLEPLSVVRLDLVRGRGDLMTVTGAQTIVAHHRILTSHGALDLAQRACQAVDRTCVADEPAPLVHGLVRTLLAVLDADPKAAGPGLEAAFGVKLLYALGVQPAVGACGGCGTPGPLVAFDAAEGAAVCAACRRPGAVAVGPATLGAVVEALGTPLSDAPTLEPAVAGEVRRLVTAVAEQHLGVAVGA